MGWWWKSSPKDEQPKSNSGNDNAPQSASPSSSTSRELTPDEQAEASFKQFLAGLENEDTKRKESGNELSSSTIPSSSSTTESSQTPTRSSIAPESLYPDTMSCRSAFDYAFFCQSFGGQFVNVYRYGELRSCSEHWNNFWLCMKTRTYPEEERKKAIRDHYRKKAIKYKTGPSSEDVWDLRMEPVRDAFLGDFEKLERQQQLEQQEMQQVG